MSRSALYVANTSTQTLASGNTVNLGSIVRRYGGNVNLCNGNIVVSGAGYYDVDASFTITGTDTTAAIATITLLKDGVAVPGAATSATISSAGTTTIGMTCVVRDMCCAGPSNLTFTVNSPVVASNVSVVVEKL